MPNKALLIRTLERGFQPWNVDDFKRVKPGEVIEVMWLKPRNPQFHRKVMALFTTVFEMLPQQEAAEIEYRGKKITPRRDFDQMRRWLTIEAGFYDVFAFPDGSIKIEAKSISFGKMEQPEFEALFSALINVAIKVLPFHMNETELRHAIEEILRFD